MSEMASEEDHRFRGETRMKDGHSQGDLITPDDDDDDDAIEITVMGNNKHIEELKEEI